MSSVPTNYVMLSGIDGYFVSQHTPPIYSTGGGGGRNQPATLSSTGSYLSPTSAYAIRREKSDGGVKANRYGANYNRIE